MEFAETKKCRICKIGSDETKNKLFTPCACKGDMRFVHRRCLDQLRGTDVYNVLHCNVCRYTYRIRFYSLFPNLVVVQRSATVLALLLATVITWYSSVLITHQLFNATYPYIFSQKNTADCVQQKEYTVYTYIHFTLLCLCGVWYGSWNPVGFYAVVNAVLCTVGVRHFLLQCTTSCCRIDLIYKYTESTSFTLVSAWIWFIVRYYCHHSLIKLIGKIRLSDYVGETKHE